MFTSLVSFSRPQPRGVFTTNPTNSAVDQHPFTSASRAGAERQLVAGVWWVGIGLLVTALLASCADHRDVPRAAATVALVTSTGSIGVAELSEDSQGLVSLTVTVSGLPAGTHGIHFHAIGLAQPQDSPAFNSSGTHYNPASHQHGLNNPLGTHAGDLPNLIVDSQGKGTLITTTNRITLTDGPLTLFDSDGSSLIIHANADDQITDPTGNSGGRIAGGVVVRK